MNPPMEIKYDEPTLSEQARDLRLENIIGTFPRVSAVPTWAPKTFQNSFALYVSGGTRRLYVYDFTGSAWRYAALT